MDGAEWEIVSIRFGRTDPDAEAEGIAPDGDFSSLEDGFFTSNHGPGTKTVSVPLALMETVCPHVSQNSHKSKTRTGTQVTDDVKAAQQGYSVIETESKK